MSRYCAQCRRREGYCSCRHRGGQPGNNNRLIHGKYSKDLDRKNAAKRESLERNTLRNILAYKVSRLKYEEEKKQWRFHTGRSQHNTCWLHDINGDFPKIAAWVPEVPDWGGYYPAEVYRDRRSLYSSTTRVIVLSDKGNDDLRPWVGDYSDRRFYSYEGWTDEANDAAQRALTEIYLHLTPIAWLNSSRRAYSLKEFLAVLKKHLPKRPRCPKCRKPIRKDDGNEFSDYGPYRYWASPLKEKSCVSLSYITQSRAKYDWILWDEKLANTFSEAARTHTSCVATLFVHQYRKKRRHEQEEYKRLLEIEKEKKKWQQNKQRLTEVRALLKKNREAWL